MGGEALAEVGLEDRTFANRPGELYHGLGESSFDSRTGHYVT